VRSERGGGVGHVLERPVEAGIAVSATATAVSVTLSVTLSSAPLSFPSICAMT
jgi:hypothetical protein